MIAHLLECSANLPQKGLIHVNPTSLYGRAVREQAALMERMMDARSAAAIAGIPDFSDDSTRIRKECQVQT